MTDRRSVQPLSEDAWMRALGMDDRDAGAPVAVEEGSIEDLLAAQLVGEMAFSSLATPPPSLRDRLMAQVAAEAAPPPFVLRSDESPWVDAGIPGVRRRTLFFDETTQRASFLLQLEPGAKYPPHRHAGVEECFVLQGSVRDADSSVSSGDYVRYETSSDHSPLTTETGCLLLIIGSVANERLA